MAALAHFWSSGGEILASPGRVLTLEDAYSLVELFNDEAHAALSAADDAALQAAKRRACELQAAIEAAIYWRRAGRGVAPTNRHWAA
jgi:hypothetical protein